MVGRGGSQTSAGTSPIDGNADAPLSRLLVRAWPAFPLRWDVGGMDGSESRVSRIFIVAGRAWRIAEPVTPGPGDAYTSVCSEISRASSTSTPRYLTVLSNLWTSGHRLDYLPRRTMSLCWRGA